MDLTPHRELEFSIDFVWDARLVVLPIRKMAPKEREKLVDQTRDLL